MDSSYYTAVAESAAVTVEPAEQAEQPATKPVRSTRPQTYTKPKPQPPYAVILHNDPINGFEYVIGVLMKVLRVNGVRAFVLTLKAHCAGRTVVWTGSLEVAELKADQIRSCGPDPRKVKDGAQPLQATTEPLAG